MTLFFIFELTIFPHIQQHTKKQEEPKVSKKQERRKKIDCNIKSNNVV